MAYLDRNISALEKESAVADRDTRFRLDQFTRARTWLASRSAATGIPPYPIIVGLNKTEDGNFALSLAWLESDFDAHGVRLADANGVIGVFDHCFPPMEESEREQRVGSLLRTTTIFFEPQGPDAADTGEAVLPRDLLPPLKVALRSRDGAESIEVEASINWATFQPATKITSTVQ